MCLIKAIPIISARPIMTYRQMVVVIRDGQMWGIPAVGPTTDEYRIDTDTMCSEPARLYSTDPKDFGYHSTFLNYAPIENHISAPIKVRSLKDGVEVLGIYSVLIQPKHLMYTDFEDITSSYFYLNPTPRMYMRDRVLYAPLLWDKIPDTLWLHAQEVIVNHNGGVDVIMDDGSKHVFKARKAMLPYEDALRRELRRNRKIGRIITPLWQRHSIKQFLEEMS